LPSEQAHAAFPGYSKRPSDINVPASQRSFTVSAGWLDGRFTMGVGWGIVLAATGLRQGDLVRLVRTGDASFDLAAVGANAAGQDAEQVASDEEGGAHTGGRTYCLLHCEPASQRAQRLAVLFRNCHTAHDREWLGCV